MKYSVRFPILFNATWHLLPQSTRRDGQQEAIVHSAGTAFKRCFARPRLEAP